MKKAILTFSGLLFAFTMWAQICINTVADLQAINSNLSGNYQLCSSIDLAGVSWTPIGPFTGTLDGQGYSIENLNMTAPSLLGRGGLFNNVNGAEIKNIRLFNFKIIETGAALDFSAHGTLAGKVVDTNISSVSCIECEVRTSWGGTSKRKAIGGIVGHYESTLNDHSMRNCWTRDTEVIQGNGYIGDDVRNGAGGIVGCMIGADLSSGGTFFDRPFLRDCYVDNIDTSTQIKSKGYNLGGICGAMYNAEINDAYHKKGIIRGQIVGGPYTRRVGGIVGHMKGLSFVDDSYITQSTIKEAGFYVGGIVGQIDKDGGIVWKCRPRADANIDAWRIVGGIAGRVDEGPLAIWACMSEIPIYISQTEAGGLVGQCIKCEISESFAVGPMTCGSGPCVMGGVTGLYTAPANFTNGVYWDLVTTNVTTTPDPGVGQVTPVLEGTGIGFGVYSNYTPAYWQDNGGTYYPTPTP